jgi:signal transduction histidine kinase/DNA-binding LacI/PurR family transcriptional regulator/AraC-like DNA-binding protein
MRILKRNRPTIGVLPGWVAYPGTIHSFLDFVFRGIQAAADDYECNLMFGCGLGSPFSNFGGPVLPVEIPETDFAPVGPWNTDGLITIGPQSQDQANSYFKQLIAEGFPVVYAGDRQKGPSVKVDNEGGVRLAVEHLVKHGHRRIAFIAGFESNEGDSASRLLGYQLSLKEFGLPYDPGLIEHGWHNTPFSYEAIQRIINRGETFSAVIVSNDESAVGVIEGLRHCGLEVPKDVAVIGFDDRLEARAQIPLLTTVHHPMYELGYHSVELLLQIISGKSPPDIMEVIPTHLVVRESCGCTPGVSTIPPVEMEVKYPVIAHNLDSAASIQSAVARANPIGRPNSYRIPDSNHIARVMADVVYKEMQRMGRQEVERLCLKLVDSYKLSLAKGDSSIFRIAMQQILEYVVQARDDIYTWQSAITTLKEWTPLLLQNQPHTFMLEQADDLLHQARIAITEMLRGQYSRELVQSSMISNIITQMTSRFFSAKSESEIFDVLCQNLPDLGISNAVVAFYTPDGEDKVALSTIKRTYPAADTIQTFSTREFPPAGLYSEEHPFKLFVLPLYNPEGVLGFVAIQTNVLDQLGYIVRQLDAALRSINLYEQAVEARRQAEEANFLKSRFLSIVSHELRTPLNLIFGLSNMMLEESTPINNQESAVNRKDLERVFIGAQHLESLIRDVLDLARSDVGQLDLTYETLDLREVLETVAAIGEPLSRDKELIWNVQVQKNLPPVRGDRTRLRQVVLNLVNNAVKFTVHGGVTLSARSDNNWVTVSISDTGLGIPLNEQCEIFDEFHQSTRTTARGFGGLGLGLSICKRLVEMHGGMIGVNSSGREGTGSTFYFRLPVIATYQQDVGLPSPNKESDRIVLLVKDSEGGEHLRSHLSQQGFLVEVHTVCDTVDWLSWLLPLPPEKIVLDLGLTSERGWDIIKTLKENPATRDIPVLFYALNEGEDSGSLLDINFMNKPLSTTELAQVLLPHHLIRKSQNGGPAPSILVVDDDPEILNLHTRIVETLAHDYRILQAQNGRQALEIIRTERPALVLLDLVMPEVDGFTVIETMQAEEHSRSIPVIVLTSQVLTQDDMERLNSGVASVLGKGMFTTQETLNHISEALNFSRKVGTDMQRTVMKAMAYIHQNFTENVTRSDIAAHVGLSERHLTRCFSQEVGITPMSYLNRYRVRQAKQMLEEGKRCITDIAMEVGFSNSGYFTRVFREEVGVSPREYMQTRTKNGRTC